MKIIFSKSFIISILLAGNSAWAGGSQDFWFEGYEDLKNPMSQMNHPQDSLFLGDKGGSWAEDDILFLPLPLSSAFFEPQQVSDPVSPVPPMSRELQKESVKEYINPYLLHYPPYEEEVVIPRGLYSPSFIEDFSNSFKENRGPRKQFIWPLHLVQEIEKLRLEGKKCSEMMAIIWPQLDAWQQNYFLNDPKGMKFRKSLDERKRNNLKRAKKAARKASSRKNRE